ncbi:MAG: hypothetical protein VX190_08260 [Bacteroidota bacterium]|nr:hypothetical protein [Bacteroidota bacterium]MEC7951337.1 hypothetical protein [Bacteroidota bacterium]MEC8362310.1 hypothetical protein [Bacteroidota bacterium]MEC8368136.1 hypothetical protein [Bacteroidota bacterium]
MLQFSSPKSRRSASRVLPEATPLEPNPEWREYTGHVMIVD